MWQQLETSYNIDGINKMEDELKDRTKKLDKLKGEADLFEKVSKEQNQALDHIGGKNKENNNKLYQLSTQMRQTKLEQKTLKD